MQKWFRYKVSVCRLNDTGNAYANCRINGHDGAAPRCFLTIEAAKPAIHLPAHDNSCKLLLLCMNIYHLSGISAIA